MIIEILHTRQIPFAEFFNLGAEQRKQTYRLRYKEITDLISARSELPIYSFLVESLLEQGFSLIPTNSDEFSKILKENLKKN